MMLFDLIYGNVFENCRKIYKNEERFNGQKKKKLTVKKSEIFYLNFE